MYCRSDIVINPNDLHWEFVRSSGLGGQNVNKVSTAVQLRFDVKSCDSLSVNTKARLKKLAGKRMTRKGEIIIIAQKYRTQRQNREDALSRLILLIHKAMQKPKPRKRTCPSQIVRQRRLEAKRRHSEKKKNRQTTQVEQK
ncbi:aminoacyl-tRNA hydrolase [bacterium]|nr:aminoacyl-tRNA hydrolase [bacterium]